MLEKQLRKRFLKNKKKKNLLILIVKIGVGSIPRVCPNSHPQQGGLLCYRQCPKGSHRNFHVCKYGCRSGYKKHLATCHYPMHVYWKCSGRCRRGYRRTTVCTCQIGPHTYGRKILYGKYAAPKTKVCRKGLETDAGLCYRYCGRGYYGIGPVCWKRCPHDAPVRNFLKFLKIS